MTDPQNPDETAAMITENKPAAVTIRVGEVVRAALLAAHYPQWVPGTTTGFSIGEGDTMVAVEWRLGPDAGQPYTAEVKRAEIDQLAACGRALLTAGFDVYYAAATHGNRMLIIPKPGAGDLRGLVPVPAGFTAYYVTRTGDDTWTATADDPATRVTCDVCGARRPAADMDEIPAIGYMCKPRFDCRAPGLGGRVALSDDPEFLQTIAELGAVLDEADLNEAGRQRTKILADIREGLARARNLDGPAGEFAVVLLEVLATVGAWEEQTLAAARGSSQTPPPVFEVGDASAQIIAAITRGFAG
jgi:hypothetical protein